jgi:hypothetical protein
MRVAVLTVDQRNSRAGDDRVSETLTSLGDTALLRPFERTAGDEFQGVIDRADSFAEVVEALLRDGGWNLGIGIGDVDAPLPDSTRAGRGEAFVLARDAVTSAKSSPWHLRVRSEDPGGRALETTLWLWASVLDRRTARGWEVADLVAAGSSYDEASRRLGITPSAVSQRAQAAGIVEARRAKELVTELTAGLLAGVPGVSVPAGIVSEESS